MSNMTKLVPDAEKCDGNITDEDHFSRENKKSITKLAFHQNYLIGK